MIYILLDEKPEKILSLRGELFKYLVKVRRHNVGDTIQFRSKENMNILYKYELITLENRTLELELLSEHDEVVQPQKSLHIAWCMIDTKSIEKVLPSLCEIGVKKISFISCDRTQKNFKLDVNRLNRIVESSMQQSGRSTYIEFDTYKKIQDFIEQHPQTKVFDFTENTLSNYGSIDTVLVGCEGGFSSDEKSYLQKQEVFKLDTSMVLRSESAVMAISSKILL